MPDLTPDGRIRREIVSFVRRGSRLTTAQADAWNAHHERFVLEIPRAHRDTLADPNFRIVTRELFGNDNPVIVEIGSGQGDSVASAAASRPDVNFLAFEVYRPGVAQTLIHLERLGLPNNVRIAELDAEHSIVTLLAPESLHEVWVFFADPWHKSKHHKRRLISPEFVRTLVSLLEVGGTIRTATDWADYANHQFLAFETVANEDGSLRNVFPEGPRPVGTTTDVIPDDMPHSGFSPRFDGRVRTAFENKAANAGRLVWELTYTRVQ